MNRVINFLFGKPPLDISLAKTETLENCTNCGATLTGSYCSNCGQKKVDKEDFKVSHFLGEAFHAFTHLDAKFFLTIRNLLQKPGFLTLEFIKGHRKKYMPPIQLFLVCNIVYFLFATADTFTTPLSIQLSDRFMSLKGRMVSEKLKGTENLYKQYEEQFDTLESENAKTLVIIMVPLFALFFSLMFLGQKRFFIEHLIFCFHFYCFMLLYETIGLTLTWLIILLLSLPFFAFSDHFPDHFVEFSKLLTGDEISTIIVSVVFFTFLFIAIKRVYFQSNFEAFVKAFISVILFWEIVFGYRDILFFTTFYGMKISLH